MPQFGMHMVSKRIQVHVLTNMNEKIAELAKQSGITFSHDIDNDFDEFNGDLTEILEKFAEFIVRECVLETMDAIHHNTSIRLQVYKHFGIK